MYDSRCCAKHMPDGKFNTEALEGLLDHLDFTNTKKSSITDILLYLKEIALKTNGQIWVLYINRLSTQIFRCLFLYITLRHCNVVNRFNQNIVINAIHSSNSGCHQLTIFEIRLIRFNLKGDLFIIHVTSFTLFISWLVFYGCDYIYMFMYIETRSAFPGRTLLRWRKARAL